MNARVSLSIVLMVGLAACTGRSSTEPTVASVTVTPASVTLDALAAPQQFSAKALDASGRQVTGVTVTWSSSTEGVAIISSAGVASAIANGTTDITATADGVAGSAVLTVSIPLKTCSSPTRVSLAVGEFTTFPATDCLMLPSGQNGDRYRVTVVRSGATGDSGDPPSDAVTATLKVTGLGVSASPARVVASAPVVERPALSAADALALIQSLRVEQTRARSEARRWVRDEALVATLPRSARLPTRPPSTLLRAAAKTDASDKLQFDTNTSSCTAGTVVTANLVYQNDDLAIYQDSAQRTTKPVSLAAAKLMADYYTSYAKDMVTAYFGTNPDVDGNGKLIVFVSPVVTGNDVAFVLTSNFYAKSACAASNERDMVWFNADIIRAMDGADPKWQALETVAHEAKHVVSLWDRIAHGGSLQPTWMEEGGAEIAGEMSSRIAWAANGGPPVGARVTRDDLEGPDGHIDLNRYDYGVVLRMARTIDYLSSQPNGLVVAPDGAGANGTVYGSGWHFLRWLGDGYGHASTAMADSTLFREQTDSLTPAGTQGLQQITGQSFPTLVNQFVGAISFVGSTAPTPLHPLTTYDYITSTNILRDPYQPAGEYPWPVTTSGGGPTRSFTTATYTGPIGVWGIRIHDLVSNGTGTGAQLQLSMPGTGYIVVARLN